MFLGCSAGILFLISLPYIRPVTCLLLRHITSIYPKNKNLKKTALSVAGWQNKALLVIFQVPQRFSMYLNLEDPQETMVSITSKIAAKAEEQGLKNFSYFDDIMLIYKGKFLNAPGTEYMRVCEIQNMYSIDDFRVQVVIRNKNDQKIEKISQAISKNEIFGKLFVPDCDHRNYINYVRTTLHSYCDRILRRKLDEASLNTLDQYSKGILQILKKYPHDSDIQEYFNALRKSMTIVTACYLKSFEAVEGHIQSQIQTHCAPSKTTTAAFTFSVAEKSYRFKSLEEVIKHSQYFSLVREYYTLDQVEKVSEGHFSLKDIPDVGMNPTAFDSALRYLQGEEIDAYTQDHPWELHSAALFLQIPLLQLRCELQLLQDLKNNKLSPKSLPKALDTIKFEMPCLYKGMDIKRWKLS
jgi:hypothetical protein